MELREPALHLAPPSSKEIKSSKYPLHDSSESCTMRVPLFKDSCEDKRSTMGGGQEMFRRPYCFSILQKAGAEMVGVFLVMVTACGTSIGNEKTNGDLTLLGLASAGGFSVMMMVVAIGHISGAHLNPSITIAFASKRLFPLVLVPIYLLAQLLGALLAAAVLQVLYMDAAATTTVPYASSTKAFIVEVISGFNLMFVATAVSTGSQTSGELAAIAVGATVTLNVLFAGPISGASMNPVRSLGPAIVANSYTGIWIYIFGPPLGALAGTWTHTLLGHG